jgi:small subunit ribosomal protein S23
MYLMNHKNLSKAAAYDQARREFYVHRHKEDIERRIAREEALSTGAYFGPSAIDIGLKLEDEAFENWKVWAKKEAAVARQRDESSYTSYTEDEGNVETDPDEALDIGQGKEEAVAVP